MHILFVTPYIPSLMRVRPYNFIKHLSRRHQVTLVCIAQGDEAEVGALEDMRDYCARVHPLPLSKSGALLSCCRRLFTPMPLQAAYTHLPFAMEFVSELAAEQTFDVMHVEHIRGAYLASEVRNIPRIFDSVDCITRLLKHRLVNHKGLRRMLDFEELMKMRAYEPKLASSFDSIVITSRHDQRALESLIRRFVKANGIGNGGTQTYLGDVPSGNGFSSRVRVIPNGVDTRYFQPPVPSNDSSDIVFAGRMSYYPNEAAALHFYRHVFPLIRSEHPEVRFKIVGSDPGESIWKLTGDPGVEVTGYVPDMRPHLAAAGVTVCPLTIGVGIQNKVLESMAMGKPIVASSTACKGISGIVHGRHLMRVDDPVEMAGYVLGLLENREYADELGRRARRFVEDNYSWESAFRQLEEVHLNAVEKRTRVLPAAA